MEGVPVVRSTAQALAPYRVGIQAVCPSCGAFVAVYVRSGHDLVCRDCAEGQAPEVQKTLRQARPAATLR